MTIVRRRLMADTAPEEETDTSPIILQENVLYKSDGAIATKNGLCITKLYPFEIDLDALRACSKYDSANDYLSVNGAAWMICSYTANSDGISTSAKNKNVIFDANGGRVTHASITAGSVSLLQSPRYDTKVLNSGSQLFAGFSLFMASVDTAYAYFDAVSSGGVMPVGVKKGDVIFAGKDSPYYGMKNIYD